MTEHLPLADELAAVYARMSGLLLSEETVGSSLRLVTSLAVEVSPGSAGAGITLLDARGARVTAAATGPVVERADTLQYELDEGPCLTAWADRRSVRVDDIMNDERWPRWSAAVAGTGLRSCLSTALVAGDDALGAIKLYSSQEGDYGPHSEHVLSMFAAQAAALVANVRSAENARRVTDDLKDALRSRDVIALAKGVLMGREGLTEEDAFTMLLSLATRDRTSLRDVAQGVVRSAGRPLR